MNSQNPFESLDQRAKAVTLAMEQLTAQMANVQAEAEAIHQESEALRIAAEKEAEAAKRANYRKSGRIRFHIERSRGFIIRAYVPKLPGAKKHMLYVGCLNRHWFKNEDIWEKTLEKLNGFMEHIFQLGVDYQRDVIGPGLDPGTGRSSKTNTTKEVQPTSISSDLGEQGNTGKIGSPGIDAGPGFDVGPGIRISRPRRPGDTKDDAIGRLFNSLELEDQAVITAFYMPSGVTAEKLLAKNSDKSMSVRTMALRNRLRAYFRNNSDKEFTVAKARDILQIHKQDQIRAAEAVNNG